MARRSKRKRKSRIVSFFGLVLSLLLVSLGIGVYNVHRMIETVPLSQCGQRISQRSFPITLVAAVLAQEDHAFLSHSGVNWREAKQALSYNVATGRVAYGASTIDMQVASLCYFKKLNLNPWLEKLLEVFASKLLHAKYTKEEILRAYLTVVPLAPNLRGFDKAAHYYFKKSLMQLSYAEEWSLVLTLRSLSLLNPHKTNVGRRLPPKIRKQLVSAKWRQSQTLRWQKKNLLLMRFVRNKSTAPTV